MNLSIIIPTYNEKENIGPLINRIKRAVESEIIIVDDNSPDGTAEAAQTLGVKVIKRLDKRGLGSAIIDGINAATSPIICFMDADLSHPPEALPAMLKLIESGAAQVVVGSRRVSGGGTSKWIWYRKFIHWVAKVLGSFLTPVQDLTSGFVMFDKKVLEGVKLESTSWKIGLEILVKGKYNKVIEHPIVFVEREAGKSKMGWQEVCSYLMHLFVLSLYKIGNRDVQSQVAK
jgi:dolichol-phosphate mannosyltransferase